MVLANTDYNVLHLNLFAGQINQVIIVSCHRASRLKIRRLISNVAILI